MALRIHDAKTVAKAVAAWLIQTLKASGRIAQNPIHVALERIVHQAHSGIEVVAVSRRFAEMFAEHHRVVARCLSIENGVTMVGIGETTRDVKLPLRLTQISVIARVLVDAERRAE